MILISKCIDSASSRSQRGLDDPRVVVLTLTRAAPVLLLGVPAARILHLCGLFPGFIVVAATAPLMMVRVMSFVGSPSAPFFILVVFISLFLEDSDLFPE